MGDVKVDTVTTEALHLVIDSSGDDVTGGKLAARIELVHEAGAIFEFQPRAFSTQRL